MSFEQLECDAHRKDRRDPGRSNIQAINYSAQDNVRPVILKQYFSNG